MNKQSQTASHLILIEPQYFLKNEETAENNFFQGGAGSVDAEKPALEEFFGLVAKIKAQGIHVTTFHNSTRAPDAVFPNNWFSTHADGTVRLYPMQAKSRRKERRLDIFDSLKQDGFQIQQLVDYSFYEEKNQAMEGTGSLVLDHLNKKAYAALSPRTDRVLAELISRDLGYEPILFTSTDDKGQVIYHTNVTMSVGEGFSVVCLDSILNSTEREKVEALLRESGEVIPITQDQLNQFAGNILHVQNPAGKKFIIGSERAYRAFTSVQREQLRKYGEFIHSPLTTIENLGGGSARCMLAENFLPKN